MRLLWLNIPGCSYSELARGSSASDASFHVLPYKQSLFTQGKKPKFSFAQNINCVLLKTFFQSYHVDVRCELRNHELVLQVICCNAYSSTISSLMAYIKDSLLQKATNCLLQTHQRMYGKILILSM